MNAPVDPALRIRINVYVPAMGKLAVTESCRCANSKRAHSHTLMFTVTGVVTSTEL